MGTTNLKKISLIVTCGFIILLSMWDRHFLINHTFAFAFTIFFYIKYKEISARRYIYILALLFSIMGAAFRIPLGEGFILSQLNVYYVYVWIYLSLYAYEVIKNKEYKKVKVSGKLIYILPILFITYVYTSVFIADDKILAIRQLFIYTNMFAIIVMVIIENYKWEDRKSSFNLLGDIILGILIFGTLKILTAIQIEPRSIYTDFNIINADNTFMRRIPTVFFYNPNDYAFLVTLVLITLVDGVVNAEKVKITFKQSSIFLMAIINLVFTMSRTAWIVYVFSLIVLLIHMIIIRQKMKVRRSLGVFIISMTILVGIFFIPGMGPYYGKLNDIKHQIQSKYDIRLVSVENPYLDYTPQDKGKDVFGVMIGGENSINRRVTLIYDVIKGVIFEKNYLGFGVGNTRKYIMIQNNTYGLYEVHCLWIELLGDFGIPGMLIFVLLYSYMLLLLMKNAKKDSSVSRYIIYLIALSILVFSPSSVVNMPVFWITIAFVYSKVIELKLLEAK